MTIAAPIYQTLKSACKTDRDTVESTYNPAIKRKYEKIEILSLDRVSDLLVLILEILSHFESSSKTGKTLNVFARDFVFFQGRESID